MSSDLNVYEYVIGEGLKTYTKDSNSNTPPVHPDYTIKMNPSLKKGDLVETYDSKVGLVLGTEESDLNIHIYINGANNRYYNVLINGVEKAYVGYSLKKNKKKS